MAINYQLELIPELASSEVAGLSGVFTHIHWRLTGTLSGTAVIAAHHAATPPVVAASAAPNIIMTTESRIALPPPEKADFIPASSVSSDVMLGWLSGKDTAAWIAARKAEVAQFIADKVAPPTIIQSPITISV